MKRKLIVGAGVTFLVVVIFFFVEVFLFLNSVPTHEKNEKIVTIQRGAPFLKIARHLRRDGVITNEIKFYLLARWHRQVEKIRAGEYRLYTNLKPTEVLDTLVSGRTFLHRAMIPEGYNMYQIADVLASLSLVRKETFLASARDKNLLIALGISGPSVEGYLFPDSYFFSKPVTADKIIKTMVARFRKNYTEEIRFNASQRNMTENDIVVLASIIEKETGVARERRLISAVLHNRLKKGMHLQMDPTVIYGIYEKFNGNLTRRDLRAKTAYNTYVIKGLPVGPIANPGAESLKAAANPAPVKYLYFVSKNDGSHYFSDNYRDHTNAVNRYQRRKKKK